MICPHCGENLLYRERAWRKCSKCKQPFALEPKTNLLGLHDVRFRTLTQKLSEDGRLFYTADQLRHQASRKKLAATKYAPIRNLIVSTIGMLIFCVILGYILQEAFSSVLGVLAGFVLFLAGFGRAAYQALQPQRLPMDLKKFNRDVLERWQKIYNQPPPGLADAARLRQMTHSQADPAHLRAVLACPLRDVLDCLRANEIPSRLQLGLLPTQGPFTPAEEAILAVLRQQTDMPLLLLHDADPEGCLLRKTVIPSLRLLSYHHIVDLGLRPAQVIRRGMLKLHKEPSDSTIQALKHYTAPPGTPADSPEALRSYLLLQEERDWLSRGHYSPLLAISPARLIKVVTQAVQRPGAAPLPLEDDEALDPEAQAEAQARAVGFMTWPGA